MQINKQLVREILNVYKNAISEDAQETAFGTMLGIIERTAREHALGLKENNTEEPLAEAIINKENILLEALKNLADIASRCGSWESFPDEPLQRAYAAVALCSPAQQEPDIADMVNRFLGWKLPKDFSPDCGITFKHNETWGEYPNGWPIGTNLFTADQAKAMFEHCLLSTVQQEPAKQHHDDFAVDLFATTMKAKMAASREKGRGGWDRPDECDVKDLAAMLVQHVEKGDPVDIANFCMMIWNRVREIGPDTCAPIALAAYASKNECSNTNAGQVMMEDPITGPRGLLGAACHAIERKKDSPAVLARLREFTTGARSGYSATPAQATPEGVALDDLAVSCGAASMVSAFTHPNGPRTAVKFKVGDGSLERFAAAMAAIIPVLEPVYQVRGNGGDWEDIPKESYAECKKGEAEKLYEWRILYRAAPLQQGEK